jgi:4'-phosphopantetheinyl transferase
VGAKASALGMTRGWPSESMQSVPRALPASLPVDELHVWRASLDAETEVSEMLHRVLAADERERARRFRFERDRSRYVAGRGLLRVLLGRYVGCNPGDIRFTYGQHGKPRLDRNGPWFNVSHSGPLALFAFSSSVEVGVDVELDDADFSRDLIAERFFSPAEVKVLRSLPDSLQPRAFLSGWTRKEAFIKARGDGLSLPLDSFDVTLAPGQPVAILRTAGSGDEPTEWSLMDLSDPERGFIAAVAGRTSSWRVIRSGVAAILDNELAIDQEER